MGRSIRSRVVVVVALATVAFGLVGGGVAHSLPVTFSVPSPDGLTDGQAVQISLAGINAIAQAQIEVSECVNAYADNTLLPSLNPASDCQVLGRIDVSGSPTLVTSVNVFETGVGLGNRSCVSNGNFACDLRVTKMTNQLTSPLPPPVAITFASDPVAAAPTPTTTTIAVYGSPVGVGKPVFAHVTVASQGSFVPQGTIDVQFDDQPVSTVALDTKGTATVALGQPPIGDYMLDAQFEGNGSFAASAAPSTQFSVIAATNITAGDVSVVEGNSGIGKVALPIVLSQPSAAAVTVNYTIVPDTATSPSDFVPAPLKYTGVLKFPAGVTSRNLFFKINGDTGMENDESFKVDLSAPTAGWDLRRPEGVVTILDDDNSPSGGMSVGIGDVHVPEGDTLKPHVAQLPITLSDPVPLNQSVKVTVILSSVNAAHRTTRTAGDWGGVVKMTYTFKPGQVRKNILVTVVPDITDEPDLMIAANVSTIVSTGPVVSVQRGSGTLTIMSDE